MKKNLTILTFVIMLAGALYYFHQGNKSKGPGDNDGQKEVLFTFVVLGDSKILPDPQWRGNKILTQLVEAINKDNPNLVFYLGDGPDEGGPISNMVLFRETLNRLNSPWYPTIGNHEIYRGGSPEGNAGDGERNFQEVFSDKLPVKDAQGKRVSYYSFDYHGSHFIVLDTAWQAMKDVEKNGLQPQNAQWEWLVRDLESSRPRSEYIFIFGHEPPLMPYSAREMPYYQKVSDLYGSTWNNPHTVESFIQLCRQYRVDTVFSGHFHTYLNFKDGETTHMISGGAGANLHVPPEYGGYYHYVRCFVEKDRVSYQVMRLN